MKQEYNKLKELLSFSLKAAVLFIAAFYIGYNFTFFAIRFNESLKTFVQPTGRDFSDALSETSCKGKELYEFAWCLNHYVAPFYKYNMSMLNKNFGLDLDVLKKEGAVCWGWAELYSRMAREAGFRSEVLDFQNGNKNRHAVAIIIDNESNYCILDQDVIVGCRYF